MSNLIKDLSSANAFFKKDAERVVEKLRNEATIMNGVIRWKSNERVPPMDCLELAVHIGLPINIEKCLMSSQAEIFDFLNNYRNESNEENDAEARAEFGPGVEMVNVISGRRWTT